MHENGFYGFYDNEECSQVITDAEVIAGVLKHKGGPSAAAVREWLEAVAAKVTRKRFIPADQQAGIPRRVMVVWENKKIKYEISYVFYDQLSPDVPSSLGFGNHRQTHLAHFYADVPVASRQTSGAESL
jgi:hypothetical protein